jgi:hypothetical protein
MQSIATLSEFAGHLRRLIRATSNREIVWTEELFGDLALNLFELQRELNEPYRSLCLAAGKSKNLKPQNWKEVPAVPTSAFKDFELSCLPTKDRTTVFHSSGTTQHRPSRHFHNIESLAVYEESLLTWFGRNFQVENRIPIISLTPPRSAATHSSLVYMFESLQRKFGNDDSPFAGEIAEDGGWTLNVGAAVEILQRGVEIDEPILILGTAFSYVHLLDNLIDRDIRFNLPAGSRVMETGGYKGRSRAMPKQELHQLICYRFGLRPTDVVCEFGMSELSSQAYDWSPIRSSHSSQSIKMQRVFHFPAWARVQIVSPETGREVNEGESGLIRVFDLANVCSVMAIQTEDLGIRRGNGFELVGRASLAEARGCSLMAV